MTKQTTLRNLLQDSKLTIQAFSDRIGINKSTFEKHLLNNFEKHLNYTKLYFDKFPEVKEIHGYDKDEMIKFLK